MVGIREAENSQRTTQQEIEITEPQYAQRSNGNSIENILLRWRITLGQELLQLSQLFALLLIFEYFQTEP